MALEQSILQGLINRGLPPHVAQAFVMNFKDESGLNPGINETDPIVAGSRGGFGLAQWTGPRRRALEQFASSRGAPVSDANMQLDFLMTELRGPESGAFKAIMAAPDVGSAASAIVNKFERPAPEHAARRTAKYSGMADGPKGQEMYPPATPSSPFLFGGGLLAQNPINPELAALAGEDEDKATLGGLLSAIGKAIPDAPQPNLGPMPDARKTGGLLTEYMNQMKRRA